MPIKSIAFRALIHPEVLFNNLTSIDIFWKLCTIWLSYIILYILSLFTNGIFQNFSNTLHIFHPSYFKLRYIRTRICWACTQMIPRIIVSGGANSNPAFLKASPNAKIPEPTLPLNRCIMVSRYLQLSNRPLVHSFYFYRSKRNPVLREKYARCISVCYARADLSQVRAGIPEVTKLQSREWQRV